MTTPPQTPDPMRVEDEIASHTELASAERQLTDRLGAFQDAVDRHIADALQSMQERTAAARDELATNRSRHTQAAQRLSSHGEADSFWRAVRTYQSYVIQDIVSVLETFLESERPDQAVHATASTCLEQMFQLASGLPRLLELPDVTSIYRVIDSDNAVARFRKAFERATRATRKAGRRIRNMLPTRRQASIDARRVEVRFLAEYHCRVRLAAFVEASHENTQQTLSLALSSIGDALAQWLLEQLAVEHALDAPAFHRPPDAPVVNGEAEVADAEDETDYEAFRQRALASADKLTAAFDHAVACIDEVDTEISSDDSDTWAPFELDVSQAGTFLLRHRDRRPPRPSRSPAHKLEQSAVRWGVWHRKLLGRLSTVRQIVSLRTDLNNIEDRLLTRLFQSALAPLYDAFLRIKKGLAAATDEVTAACNQHTNDRSHVELARKLQSIQRATLKRLTKVIREAPGIVAASDVLTDPGREEWDETLAIIRELPREIVVHRVRNTQTGRFSPPMPSFSLNLREIAADAIDPPLPDQLHKTATPLMKRITQAWDGAAKVEDIVRFNLGATIDELTAVDQPPENADDAPVIDRARELATQALRRSMDTLDDLSESLSEPWSALEHAAFQSFQDDWGDVQRRLRSEGAVEERLVGLRTRLTRSAERRWVTTKAAAIKVGHRFKSLATNTTRWVRRLIARGQAAVGTQEVAVDESTQTLDILADLPGIQARLPLVYRKLFSFEPLTEHTLLEGRSRDLVKVRRHFSRWQSKHDAGVFVLSSRLGDGRTTFLNVLAAKVFSKSDVKYAALDRRIRTADEFAVFLADTLGVEHQPEGGLPALRETLTNRSGQREPLVCMLDNLEHIVLQGTGTNDLIEAALMFFSRTDRYVYWIATIGYESWRFITKTTGSATGFVTYHALTPIDRATVEDLIFTRHRRSGIPVSFAEPTSPSPILRQRLRRARTDERKQNILRKEYFDALYANAEQDIRLALFYWIMSVDFETREDEVLIKPFEPLAFRFLGNLDQIRSFTLKAFVVHNTLTLEEHRSIFRLPEDESVFVLESLLNQRLIEPAQSVAESTLDAGVLPGHAYRIRRLALNPVIKHLRDKHFIY